MENLKLLTAQDEYRKNPEVKKEDIIALQEWNKKQPHLPRLDEFQLILFYQSNYFNSEATKQSIENYFTIKTHIPEVFSNRLTRSSNPAILLLSLPRLTPEGYKVILARIIDPNPNNFDCTRHLTVVDLTLSIHFAYEGSHQGLVFVMDSTHQALGHITKTNPLLMKKFIWYLQEAIPIRLKSVHIINTSPIVEVFVNFVKPYLNKNVMDLLHVHSKMETFYKFVPPEILPSDFPGGEAPSIEVLKNSTIRAIKNNEELFKREEELVVNESLRIGKSKFLSEVNVDGMDGTFKKISID